MSFNLESYLDDELPVFDAVDLAERAPTDRPSEIDIWYYELETACGIGAEDRSLSDDELLDLHGCPSVAEWGWLYFIIEWLGMYGILAANWGVPVLKVGEDARYSSTNVDERRAQAVYYFLEIMKERGFDPLTQARNFMAMIKEETIKKGAPFSSDKALLDWLKSYNEFIYYVYVAGSVTIRPDMLNSQRNIVYSEKQAADLLSRIRAAAANRRARWNAPYDLDRMMNREAQGIQWTIKVDSTYHRGDNLIGLPDDELIPKLRELLAAWREDPNHTTSKYVCSGQFPARERLLLMVAHHETLREMLREPEHRNLAREVKQYVEWLYLPYVKKAFASKVE